MNNDEPTGTRPRCSSLRQAARALGHAPALGPAPAPGAALVAARQHDGPDTGYRLGARLREQCGRGLAAVLAGAPHPGRHEPSQDGAGERGAVPSRHAEEPPDIGGVGDHLAGEIASRVGVDEVPAGRVSVDPAAEVAETGPAPPVGGQGPDAGDVRGGARPVRPAGPAVASRRDAGGPLALPEQLEPLPEGEQRKVSSWSGRRSTGGRCPSRRAARSACAG